MAPQQGFRTFSLHALRAARRARSLDELTEGLCRGLTAAIEASLIELWIREGSAVRRWSLDAASGRFSRAGEVDPAVYRSLEWAGHGQETTAQRQGDVQQSVHQLLVTAAGRPPTRVSVRPIGDGRSPDGHLVIADGSPDEALLDDLALAVSAVIVHYREQRDRLERVKELSCLYELAKLATQPQLDLAGSLERVVALLPPSWQHPEIAAARLVLDDRTYSEHGFDEAWQSQRSEIEVAGRSRGFVEVAYVSPMPELDEGPFLNEERRLLDTVAREVSTLIERKGALEDRAHLQEQLQHADRLATIGHLAAGVAHELNEPLGAILGFAQLARKHRDIPAGVDRDLEKIEAAALHAREVTARLMHVGRRNAPKLERLDLNTVVRDGLSFLGARLAKHRIELRCSLESELQSFRGNRAQLQQIVINLVVNAIQAMPSGGRLTVTTESDGSALALIVQDSGVGMEPAVQARIFEPFFTTKTATEGTGLGLPVVRGILESMGGNINVTSEPGAGSSFHVRIPLVLGGSTRQTGA